MFWKHIFPSNSLDWISLITLHSGILILISQQKEVTLFCIFWMEKCLFSIHIIYFQLKLKIIIWKGVVWQSITCPGIPLLSTTETAERSSSVLENSEVQAAMAVTLRNRSWLQTRSADVSGGKQLHWLLGKGEFGIWGRILVAMWTFCRSYQLNPQSPSILFSK